MLKQYDCTRVTLDFEISVAWENYWVLLVFNRNILASGGGAAFFDLDNFSI